MSEKPTVAKGNPRKPPADSPTTFDQEAATIAPDEASAIAHVAGKVIRKDPGAAGGATQPLPRETVDMPSREEQAEGQGVAAANPSARAAPATEKGTTILGDYRLLQKLGQGGMGAVFKAHQISRDRVVAIKVLSKELASKEANVKRFEREAKMMLKLDHPNILRCFNVDQARGYHFLAMEFIEGGSVENWLRKLGTFSVGDALHIILKTAAALQYAHAQKTIHRDVKPDNILLTTDGVVKVADLGLAKDTSDDMALTKTGAGAGTPIYMAPEQARDVKHVDARVDIYALGIMLYVFLTGKPPFTGATLVDLISAKEKGKFDLIRRHNDEVPPKIDLIVDKMLAKDPKMRYASCQEVIDELAPLGLANDELSFLQREDSLLPASDRKPAKTKGPAPLPAKTQSPTAKAVTSAPKTADEDTQMPVDEQEIEHDVWYFKLVTAEGRQITKKVSAEQLRTLIKSGHLDPTSEISRHEKSGFRPAATFAEFQAYFKAREANTKANVKGHKYKSKMEEIVAEDERRRKYGWIGRLFKNVGGTVFGLIWIAVILGIVAAAGYFGWKYLNP